MTALKSIAIIFLLAMPTVTQSATLTVCASKIAGDPVDLEDEFSYGDIALPAGTVFQWAGHAFGLASDPKDTSHDDPHGSGWRGISAAEQKRRMATMVPDFETWEKHSTAVITLQAARLTKAKYCSTIPAAAVESPDWRWTQTPVFGRPDIYFQIIGVMVDGEISTDFDDDTDPLSHAAARGEVNGILDGTTSRTIKIK